MTSDPVVPRGDGALIRPRVSSNATSTALTPLIDGRAGAEVERLLAEKTRVAPSRTRAVGGVGAGRVRQALASRPR